MLDQEMLFACSHWKLTSEGLQTDSISMAAAIQQHVCVQVAVFETGNVVYFYVYKFLYLIFEIRGTFLAI